MLHSLLNMRNSLRRWPKFASLLQFLRIILLFGIAVLTFVTVLFSVIIRPILQAQVVEMAKSTFQRCDSDVIMAQKTAKNLGIQILLDRDYATLLNATVSTLNSATVNDCFDQLRLLKSTNSDIHSIYLINNRMGMVFSTYMSATTTEEFAKTDSGILDWIQDKDNIRILKKRTSIRDTLALPEMHSDVYTFVVPNRYDGDYLESAVVVNVSLRELSQRMSSYYELQSDTYLRVSDYYGTLIEFCSIGDRTDLSELSSWSHSSLNQNLDNASKTINGKQYMLINSYSSASDSYFSLIQPKHKILEPLNKVQQTFMIIISSGIFFEIILSLLISKKIQKVFEVVETKRQELSTSLQKNIANSRERFWRTYLSGELVCSAEELGDQLKKWNILNVDYGSICILSVIPQEGNSVAVEERNRNQVPDLFVQAYSSVNPLFLFRQNNMFTFLLRPKTSDRLSDVSAIPSILTEGIPLNFHIIGTSSVLAISEYPTTWIKISQSVSLSFFYPFNKYLDCQMICAEHQDASNCSDSAIVREIISGLINTDQDKVLFHFLKFEEMLANKTYDCYFNHLSWLAMSITNTATSAWLQIAHENSPTDLFHALSATLLDCTSRTQVIERFSLFLNELTSMISLARKNSGTAQKVELVRRFVEENYADHSLSIDSIAAKFSLSSDYLRKVFKSSTGLSLSEFISQIRLQAAAEELAMASTPLKEIAETLGFTNSSYFCTSFKKRYGMTPTQYRSAHNKQPKDT